MAARILPIAVAGMSDMTQGRERPDLARKTPQGTSIWHDTTANTGNKTLLFAPK